MNQPSPYVNAICSQIEIQSGFKIKNIGAAKRLSDLLANDKLFISSYTIGRLFGVIKPYRTPYKSTLNTLANYLKFKDWDAYCENQTNIPFDTNYFLTEFADGFSISVLNACLIDKEGCESLELVLNKLNGKEKSTLIYSAGEILGFHIREIKEKNNLLEILGKNANGQLLFYESFVDEDNHDNYFSKALENYYLPNIDNEYRKLFAYGFLINQKLYKQNEFSEFYFKQFITITNQIELEKCHYHEVSRFYECLIIFDSYNGIIANTWENHINELLENCKSFNIYEKAWIVSRVVKTLLYFNFKKELFHHKGLNELIEIMIKTERTGLHTIALYAIQLYWLYRMNYLKNKIVYKPFRINNIFFQNTKNEKLAIELGIAYLFSVGENKIILNKNINQFCKERGLLWVIKLIY